MQAIKRDYYEVLGVARDADAAAIKDAFRSPGAEERRLWEKLRALAAGRS